MKQEKKCPFTAQFIPAPARGITPAGMVEAQLLMAPCMGPDGCGAWARCNPHLLQELREYQAGGPIHADGN